MCDKSCKKLPFMIFCVFDWSVTNGVCVTLIEALACDFACVECRLCT